MTPRQARVYEYLLERIHDPVPPTLQELTDALGYRSKGSTHAIIKALEQLGKVKRDPGMTRSLRAVPPPIRLDQRELAIVILDAMYGPRMGEFYLDPRRESDTRHGDGMRAARAVIDHILKQGL